MRRLLHYFEVKLYKLALWITAKGLIRHQKKWGGNIDDINGIDFVRIANKEYFLKYRLYRKETNNTRNDVNL